MPTVTEDLVGTTASHSAEGVEIQRAFHITDLAGNASAKAELALNANRIPRLGDPHPSNGSLVAVDKNVSFAGATNAQVVVNYRIPKFEKGDPPPGGPGEPDVESSHGTITVGASLSTQQTSLDRNLKQILVSHFVTTSVMNDDFSDTIETDTLVDQVRTVDIQLPQAVIRVQRVEVGSPSRKARTFVGAVNSRALGKAKTDGPGYWLCTRIDGVSNDGGTTYNVTYEFQHNAGTWDVFVEWIDPETGLPVPSRDYNNKQPGEAVTYEIYRRADFGALNLFLE